MQGICAQLPGMQISDAKETFVGPLLVTTPPQNLAKDFKDVVFLKFYGNSSTICTRLMHTSSNIHPMYAHR